MDFGKRALEGQVGQVEVGVDVKRLTDLSALRDHLDPHQAVAVIDGDQVVAIRGNVGSTGHIAVLADHSVGDAVQDELGLGGAGGVGLAVDKVVAPKVGVGQRLGDAIVLLQTDVFHIGCRLQVDFVECRLIPVKDESKPGDGFKQRDRKRRESIIVPVLIVRDCQ